MAPVSHEDILQKCIDLLQFRLYLVTPFGDNGNEEDDEPKQDCRPQTNSRNDGREQRAYAGDDMGQYACEKSADAGAKPRQQHGQKLGAEHMEQL